MIELQSWGLYPFIANQKYIDLPNRFSITPAVEASLLPRGLGRSYGDSCLNAEGTLLGTRYLNHFISFDPNTGILRCESGVSFDDLLQTFVPHGWFPPVTPGTKFITVGGAIANDVHGKNHHIAGNFGNHVLSFELLRSDGQRFLCSRTENSNLFHATIGGLGLTGVITWAEFEMKKIESSWIHQEQIQFHSLGDFFAIAADSEHTHEFTVAWIDCLSQTDIRGLFIRGNFVSNKSSYDFQVHKDTTLKSIPFFFPDVALNKYSIKAFNELYFRKNLRSRKVDVVHYEPFFYPLDSIHHWNRIYGKRGFLQYQFVVPLNQEGLQAVEQIIHILNQSKMGSFLAVLKTFGKIPSEGLLSFPKEGVTLALDFPNHGNKLLEILKQCDSIVCEVGGSVYPAKDARMSSQSFSTFFPQLEEFKKFKDPNISSSFWRRVTCEKS